MQTRRISILAALSTCALLGSTSAQTLLVSSRMTDEVLAFDAATGAPLGAFANTMIDNPVGIGFAPDGQLYVASANDNRIVRFDGVTGAYVDDVVAGLPLDGPRDIAFGPCGTLFVGNAGTDEVLRFDPANGALLGRYGGGGLDGPTGFTFDEDGDLWVGGVISNELVRFDVDTGVWLETRASPLLRGPHDLALGPDGWIYVTNATGAVPRLLRFDPRPGGLVEPHAAGGALQFALGMQWTHDGDLLVANQGRDEVRKFVGVTSPTGSILVAGGAGGLDGPLFLALQPTQPGPRVIAPAPGSSGSTAHFAFDGLTPGGWALGWFDLTLGAPGAAATPLCPGLRLDLARPRPFLARPADGSGLAGAWRPIPNHLAGTTLLLQVVDVATCRTSPVVRFLP